MPVRALLTVSLVLGVLAAACAQDDRGTGGQAGALGGAGGTSAGTPSGAAGTVQAGATSGGSSGADSGGSGAGSGGAAGSGSAAGSGGANANADASDASTAMDAASDTDAAGDEGGVRADGYRLVWSDSFDGTAIDSGKWEHEVNCWGGGNNEDQCYVADAKNSFVQDGLLHIVALDDAPSGAVGGPDNNAAITTKGHSSARLRTRERGDWKYGRIEVRAQLPYGQGLWPAIWMLPTDNTFGGWALSGEIDIMEAVNLGTGGNNDNRIHGTLHYGGAWPNNVHTGTSYVSARDVTAALHEYAVEWEEGEIRWFVDGEHYATQTNWYSSGNAYPAPFDQRFHLLLNVAVGGQWPGPPNSATTFPQTLFVDYVRVYACDADPETGHGCGSKDESVTPLAGISGP